VQGKRIGPKKNARKKTAPPGAGREHGENSWAADQKIKENILRGKIKETDSEKEEIFKWTVLGALTEKKNRMSSKKTERPIVLRR